MAKSNRISDEKETKEQTPDPTSSATQSSVAIVDSDEPRGSQFVGQWNGLISTTNWEKGRIICDWREALMAEGAAVTEYSDEAWAQLVGGVTSQHIGRLRRVSQRFGEVLDQYEGLYWSHFQAAMDWDDAEMWLEGSLQNDWSVSQMRGRRWETLGTPPEQQQAETQATAMQLDEDFSAAEADPQDTTDSETTAASTQTIQAVDADSNSKEGEEEKEEAEAGAQVSANKRQRLDVSVEELPNDLADAFEQFKLAIIAHRRENWQDTTPEAVIECLDALRVLTLAESED